MIVAPHPGVAPIRAPSPSRSAAGATIGSYALGIGVMLATTIAVLAGGWVQGAGATAVVAVVAVTEAILLGRSGLNRLGAVLLAVPLCAAVVIPVTVGIIPPDAQTGFPHVMARYLVAAITGLLATDDWAFTVGLGTVIWLTGYWLGWVAFRERSGVLAVLPAVVILAVNALNALNALSGSTLGQVGIPETFALGLMLLLIGSVELGSLASSWRWRRVPMLPRLRSRFTGSTAAAVAAVVLVGLLLPPATTTDISNAIFHNNAIGDRSGGSGSGGTSLVQFSTSTDPGGPLKSVPRAVFTYYTDQPFQGYLRAVNDTVFSRGTWTPATGGSDGVRGATSPPGALPRDRDPASGAVGAATVRVNLHITSISNPPTGPAFYALFAGEPDALGGISGAVLGSVNRDGRFLSVDSVRVVGPDPGRLNRLDTTGLASTAVAAQLRAAGKNYPQFVKDDLQLRSSGDTAESQQLGAIAQLAAQWSAGTTNPYDAAASIESHLRGYTYTLSPPPTPAGTWPIVYFLTTSKQGYCQYYASSMGAMLRTLGIPSRVVTGYGAGSSSNEPRVRSDRPVLQVSTSDAHSWVEAYFPGYGWIPFEPTPPSSLGDYQPLARGGAGPAPTLAPSAAATSRAGVTPKSEVAAGASSGGSSGGPLSGWTGPGLTLVVVAVAAALGLAWWRRPRSLAGVWRRLAVAARAAGVRRDPAETRTAFAQRVAIALGREGQPALHQQLNAVAAVTGKAEFGREGIGDEDAERWRMAWVEIARELPRHLRRRSRRH